MATCIANGKFDLLHVGHFNLLMYCRRLIGYDGTLIVAIDTDDRIKELEGKEPLYPAEVRQKHLLSLKLIDQFLVSKVVRFASDYQLENLIKYWKADILVKGSDWAGKKVIGSDLVDKVAFYQLDTFGDVGKISSSSIIKTILDRYGKPSI